MMEASRQRGLTLVELLVVIAITSLILVAVTGVVQVGLQVAATWGKAVSDAQTSNRLAAWLQRDTDRYTPCLATVDTLKLCLDSTTVITYQMSGGDLVRADGSTGASAVVTRGAAQPGFGYSLACGPAVAVATGTLTVSSPALTIPFRAPAAACPP